MKERFRQLTMILLVVSMSVFVESHMKASSSTNSSSETMLTSCERDTSCAVARASTTTPIPTA